MNPFHARLLAQQQRAGVPVESKQSNQQMHYQELQKESKEESYLAYYAGCSSRIISPNRADPAYIWIPIDYHATSQRTYHRKYFQPCQHKPSNRRALLFRRKSAQRRKPRPKLRRMRRTAGQLGGAMWSCCFETRGLVEGITGTGMTPLGSYGSVPFLYLFES